eukprot:7639047-Pyramimonas_sp.AAC.1
MGPSCHRHGLGAQPEPLEDLAGLDGDTITDPRQVMKKKLEYWMGKCGPYHTKTQLLSRLNGSGGP